MAREIATLFSAAKQPAAVVPAQPEPTPTGDDFLKMMGAKIKHGHPPG